MFDGLYIELYNLPLGSAEVQAVLLLSVLCKQQSSSFDHSHEFLVQYMLLLQDQRHKMTIAIFTRLQVPFMMDNSNSSKQQSTALWNIVIIIILFTTLSYCQ